MTRTSFPALALAALLAYPASAGTTEPPAPKAAPKAAEAPKDTEGLKDLVKWKTLDEAEAEAKKTGKPLLMFFTADWCEPCQKMGAQVFTDKDLAGVINDLYVPVAIVDQIKEMGMNPDLVTELYQRFKLSAFPTFVVTRPGYEGAVRYRGFGTKEKAGTFLRGGRKQLEENEKNEKADKKAPKTKA